MSRLKVIIAFTVVVFLLLSILALAQTEKDKSQFKHERTGDEISIVRCVFDKTAYFTIGIDKKPTGNDLIDAVIFYFMNIFTKSIHFLISNEKADLEITHDKNFSFILSGLDTDKPIMKGNMGETPLHILWKTEDTIYLAEITPAKNAINYITLFPGRKIVIFSKQYIMLPFKGISAFMCVGHFE